MTYSRLRSYSRVSCRTARRSSPDTTLPHARSLRRSWAAICFDFSIFDEKVFSVAVGDASGHGLPAALLVRDVVTGLRMGVEKEMKMAEAMRKLNGVIHRSTLSANFVSLFFAQIESTGNVF